MQCKNGDTLIGTWDKDRMNGVFCIKNGNNEQMTLFKEGMRINLTYDTQPTDYLYYIISFLLIWVFGYGIYAGLTIQREQFGFCAAWLIYLCYSYSTNSCKYLGNMVELVKTFENIAQAIEAAPDCGFSI